MMTSKRTKLMGLGALCVAGAVAAAAAPRDWWDVDSHVANWLNGRARAASVKTSFSSVEVTNTSGRLVGLVDSDSTGDGIGGYFNRSGNVRIGFLISAQDAGQIYVAPST